MPRAARFGHVDSSRFLRGKCGKATEYLLHGLARTKTSFVFCTSCQMNHKTLKLTKSGYKYHEKAHASPLAILRAVSIRLVAAYLFLFGTVQAQTLDVFAAASLNEVFMDLGKAFEAERPGMSVRLNSAGSAVLATQLVQGAAADVFASADLETLLRIVSEGEARAFASYLTHAHRSGAKFRFKP